jgi:hypothetical protein
MSILTYAPLDNLAAPVVTGSTTQLFQDIYGEVWVADSGIRNGLWFKAREVLHGHVTRVAAFTPPVSTPGVFGWDTVVGDPFGMWTGGPTYGFLVPVAGWYHVNAQWYCTIPTLGDYSGIRIYGGPNSATMLTNENMIQNVAGGGVHAKSQLDVYAAANDTFTMQYWTSVAGTGSANLFNHLYVSYLGSA